MPDRTRLRRRVGPASVVLAFIVASAGAARAGTLEVSLSSHYSTGDYGTSENTDIVYVPLLLRYETGPWTLKVLLPWLRISGGSAVVETPGGPVTTKAGTNEGVGDMLFEVDHAIAPFAEYAPWITLGLRVKAPTASRDDGLGTGYWDAAPGVELAQRYGRWTPYLAVGYRILGDGHGVSYHDGFVASVGTMLQVLERVEGGVFLDWRQAASAGGDDSLELLPTWRLDVSDDWTVDGYVSVGFTDAVPDVGTGLEIERRFGSEP